MSNTVMKPETDNKAIPTVDKAKYFRLRQPTPAAIPKAKQIELAIPKTIAPRGAT